MLKQLLSVFLEFSCQFCNRPVNLQPNCRTPERICRYCGDRLLSHQLANSDRLKLYQARSTFAWGKYDGSLKRAIAEMKYKRQPEIGSILGTLLGQAWLDCGLVKQHPKVTLVPIPMYSQKQKLRGFNQAEIIASSFGRVTGYRSNKKVLIRERETAAMFELDSRSARVKNLENALQIGSQLPKYPVLLIDDIYTTGTTVKEATKVLQAEKIKTIGVAIAAKAGFG